MNPYQCLLFIVLLATAAPIAAADWQLAEDSDFTFITTFEGVDTPGRFSEFEVEFAFDPADPETGRLQVTVMTGAADMGDPDMNAVLADPLWFDIANFPVAVFDSEQIEARAPGEFVATGELRLKGISRTVAVPFSWTQTGPGAEMRGAFNVMRIDFNVGSGEWATGDAIGLDVQLQFDLSLRHKE
jgi:polyisoprenoid-binding protein YceI